MNEPEVTQEEVAPKEDNALIVDAKIEGMGEGLDLIAKENIPTVEDVVKPKAEPFHYSFITDLSVSDLQKVPGGYFMMRVGKKSWHGKMQKKLASFDLRRLSGLEHPSIYQSKATLDIDYDIKSSDVVIDINPEGIKQVQQLSYIYLRGALSNFYRDNDNKTVPRCEQHCFSLNHSYRNYDLPVDAMTLTIHWLEPELGCDYHFEDQYYGAGMPLDIAMDIRDTRYFDSSVLSDCVQLQKTQTPRLLHECAIFYQVQQCRFILIIGDEAEEAASRDDTLKVLDGQTIDLSVLGGVLDVQDIDHIIHDPVLEMANKAYLKNGPMDGDGISFDGLDGLDNDLED